MHEPSVTPTSADAAAARQGGRQALAAALQASRQDTLATFAAFAQALPGLVVPKRSDLNPPLWELGHIGWFQAFWLARYPAWRLGLRADPELPRRAAPRAYLHVDADALYNSSLVPQASRWALPLPDADGTRADLAAQLAGTLALLVDDVDETDDDAMYFFRLVLHHEDMHHEAALYMAQALGIAITDARWQPRPLPAPPAALQFEPGHWQLGSAPGPGFAFDNELGAHPVALGETTIDAQALRWADYLPFAEAGGYANPRWWDAAGQAWLASLRACTPAPGPRYLRLTTTGWQQWRNGHWLALVLDQAACHLTQHEASAWCRWAGRRLPTEAEWERAALLQPQAFRWGDVWEWTTSAFTPYPGFVPHPYRDYSAPWFDGRPVLRGASFMTQARMRHPRYRNYFPAQRNDVPAGFRSCAL